MKIIPTNNGVGCFIETNLKKIKNDELLLIKKTLDNFGVIFFKKQELNPKEYISLAKNWGDLAEYPMLKGHDNYPEITIVERKPEDKGSNFGGEFFHTDSSYTQKPPRFTFLMGVDVPGKGLGNTIFANYLQIQYISNVGELSIFCGSIVGSCLGFLWYNAPPAKIFMGDTGSLSLGGSIASVAIIVKHEIVLAIIGGLFVLETVSVIIQVISFKLTGKRVFMMAPIHHHFEKKGWAESTVVIRFWIIAIILALVGLATLKLR